MASPLFDILALSEQVDVFTPCVFTKSPSAEEINNKQRLCSLVKVIMRTSCKKFNVEQQLKNVEALLFAAEKHKGVRRADGVTPYLLHALEVLYILMEQKVYDFKIFIATLIHDVVEDTETKLKEIRRRFGYAISRMVELLTKHPNFILRYSYWWMLRNERDPTIRWRVIAIKFADRIHNIMTLDAIRDVTKREAKLKETMEEFPKLYKVFIRTLRKLISKGEVKNMFEHLPFHLNNRLYYELSRYS